VYLTLIGLVELGFLRVGEKGVVDLLVIGFWEGVGGLVMSGAGGAFFANISFNCCFSFTRCVMTIFICLSSSWCLLAFWLRSLSSLAIFSLYTFLIFSTCSLTGVATTAAYVLEESGPVIGFSGMTMLMSKSEGDDGMGWGAESEKLGRGHFQSFFMKSSHI
jgi:hypothetical protein